MHGIEGFRLVRPLELFAWFTASVVALLIGAATPAVGNVLSALIG
jgi:hypothetical protein